MNLATETSIIIRWNTDVPDNSKVSFGMSPGNFTSEVIENTILERYKVDLVLNGHSHCYERSYLINGHFDVESKFNVATPGIK